MPVRFSRLGIAIAGYGLLVLAAPLGYTSEYLNWFIHSKTALWLPDRAIALPALLVAGVGYYLLRGAGLTEAEHSDRAFLALAAGGVVAGFLLFTGQ